MAKEYIDREAVIRKLNNIARDLLKDNSIQCSLAAGTIVDIKDNVIAKQRAADVAEVRHGKWCLIEYEFLICDKCGHWYYTGCESTVEAKEKLRNGDTPNYCPNCGAKMDGKDGATNEVD